jgi:hypothetical protein
MAAGGAIFCFKCVSDFVQVFHLYVAYDASICFKCFNYFRYMFHAFHLYVSCVPSICFMCFILMLQNDIMLHMLQWLHTHVSSVCFTCFICFKCMLQIYVPNVLAVFRHMFHLDGTMTIQECFNNRSDRYCRGDETLGRGKGRDRDRARRRTGAQRG